MANVFDTAKYILERYGSMSAMKLLPCISGHNLNKFIRQHILDNETAP
ncbi:hypothetical protein [Succinimonas sp.]|jgi:hypothetical protein|nr:hypothetical protein [Succinimonas sp.]